jgi:predicted O-linked N-acetylglucosamine transferase (SPINDLY family)
MATIPEALAIAVQHHQDGRLQAAEQIYRQILAAEPNHADAWHLLGVIHAQTGKRELAVECISRALTAKPDWAEAQANLGNALREQGKADEAVRFLRRALQLKPNYADAHNNLGLALAAQGKLEEAVACYGRALELRPGYVEARSNLGAAFQAQGKLDEAAACYRGAVQLKPDYAIGHNNLGLALTAQGKMEEAVACFRRAIEQQPAYAEAHNNLGTALWNQGKVHDPVAGKVPSQQVIAAPPKGRLPSAEEIDRQSLRFEPNDADAIVLTEQGKLDEAIACFRRALELKPDYADAHSNLLLALQYCTGITLKALAEAHADFDRRHAGKKDEGGRMKAEGGKTAVHPSSFILHPSPCGPLRLGFVSPDLGRHPVGYFLVRVLENLGPQEFETICYSDRNVKDDLTHRLQAAATQWREVHGLSDERLAERIGSDRIDILFDLAGHTAHNRILVFARKPAPIQVTWAGYAGTTGLKAMDYILADRHEIPPEAEVHYCERVLRMPDGYVCYDPPGYAPAVRPLPAQERGYVTFGSFNNPAKIGRQVIEVWAEVLRRVPQSRLRLKYKWMNAPSIAKRLTETFADRGIDPPRLEILGLSPHAESLAEYHRIDLALDPFPYNGGLTTCEALWMGVPVVTCPGETFAGRHSLSHLSNVGLTETIARDLDDYVDLAVSLAGNLPRLAALRAGLRQRMAASPLCDGKRFAENLASILRGVWKHLRYAEA